MTHVTKSDLETCLVPLANDIRDSKIGLYGPNTMVWRIAKEAILILGGGRAVLLQLAHPFVAYGVDEHSKTRTDPQGRFRRTFEVIHALVFGDAEVALRHARRVHQIHEHIQGHLGEAAGPFDKATPYEANATDALLWVLATLADTTVQVYERVVAPLSPEEKEQLWREWKIFGRLFGLSEAVMPDTWVAFQAYFRGMLESGILSPTRPAKEIGALLFQGPNIFTALVMKWYGWMTAGLMPEKLRDAYGMPFRSLQRFTFKVSMAVIGFVWSKLPGRLRYLPAYVEANRRMKGLPERDTFGRRIEDLVVDTFAKR